MKNFLNKDKEEIIKKTAAFIKSKLENEATGHDWWHVQRVWKIAKKIGLKEKADIFIVQLAALLHDIADWKFNSDLNQGAREAEIWLKKMTVEPDIIKKVSHIVNNISFKGAKVKNKIKSTEGKIVQDADRLDAIGAIGIARAFAYGGYKNRSLYDPRAKIVLHGSFKAYRKGSASTIHHFYEKLLLLKDQMNTKTGSNMALQRHKFTLYYLKNFYSEWHGKK